MLQKKDKELRGSNNGPIGGYHEWLKAHVQGLDWLPGLRTTKREEDEAPEEDEEVQALRTELKQVQTVKERFKSVALRIRTLYVGSQPLTVATDGPIVTAPEFFCPSFAPPPMPYRPSKVSPQRPLLPSPSIMISH